MQLYRHYYLLRAPYNLFFYIKRFFSIFINTNKLHIRRSYKVIIHVIYINVINLRLPTNSKISSLRAQRPGKDINLYKYRNGEKWSSCHENIKFALYSRRGRQLFAPRRLMPGDDVSMSHPPFSNSHRGRYCAPSALPRRVEEYSSLLPLKWNSYIFRERMMTIKINREQVVWKKQEQWIFFITSSRLKIYIYFIFCRAEQTKF